MYINYNK